MSYLLQVVGGKAGELSPAGGGGGLASCLLLQVEVGDGELSHTGRYGEMVSRLIYVELGCW